MAAREGKHATVYDFRDADLMAKLASQSASGITSADLAEEIGFGSDRDGVRAIGMRLAWMRKYGMVSYDDKLHLWVLSQGGERVMESRAKAATIKRLQDMPEEEMVEVMSHVTSVYRLGDPMIAHLLRREFIYGTQPGFRRNGRGR